MTSASSAFDALAARLRSGERAVDVAGVAGGARGHLVRLLLRAGLGPLVAVAPDEERADLLERDLRFFLSPAGESAADPAVVRLPADAVLPYDELSPDCDIERSRLATLFVLSQRGLGRRPAALVLSVRALARKVIPKRIVDERSELTGKGATLDRDELARRLAGLGYSAVPLVEDPGTFAVRGGIVDLFSPLYEKPARLELFGDEVESLRLFDPETQRTVGELSELLVCPAREILFDEESIGKAVAAARAAGDRVNRPSRKVRELTDLIEQSIPGLGVAALLPGFYGQLDTVAGYLPEDPLFLVDEPAECAREAADLAERLAEEFAAAEERGEIALPPEEHFADPEALLAAGRVVRLHGRGEAGIAPAGSVPVRFAFGETAELRSAILAHHGEEGALSPLALRLSAWRDEGIAAAVACHGAGQVDRLARLLRDRNVPVKVHPEPFSAAPDPLYDPAVRAHLFAGEVSHGFTDLGGRIAVVSDEDVFGPRSGRTVKRRRIEQPFVDAFKELNEGDLVVHVDHGIGRYAGLVRMQIRGVDGDFLLLRYDGADKLYLPVEKLRLVQKFAGGDPGTVKLDKLGGQGWAKTKQKVKEQLLRMAGELLDIYAARKVHPGHAFSKPDRYFHEFEADFPFTETPDQARAIAEVLADMEAARPMDRLVCGDVGFGKTEVALRATFKAVLDKKQVALLVPTTVLASQHYRTFRERFSDYPVTVELLSSLKSAAESRDILARLAAGTIDVVIGTHKLLSPGVAFRDLGLVVVDEEQRFGVAHKERLKKLRKVVDVLTLTATPIPRTLHMAMAGIRDLSIIATPPEDRRAIRTFVARFDPALVTEAIERELARGGQVFFVHNRVRSIEAMERFLAKICPKARLAVAHGQMAEQKLDQVMSEFIERKYDVLVCTSIIEAGLDIPSANTILVNRADTFGLAQLYQIRGRVGRSRDRAYAYLFVPAHRATTKDAARRLAALQELTELGAGFRVASHDMEIRGAGNLLGPDQSGPIAAVGFDLYTQLMDEAVRELSGEPPREEVEPEIALPVAALLPEDYLPDVHQRLLFYKKLAAAQNDDELSDIRGELSDRCGDLPVEVDNLTEQASLRIALRKLRLRGLEAGAGRLVLSLGPSPALDAGRLAAKVQKSAGRWRLTPDMKLVSRLDGSPEGQDLLEAARVLVREVASCG